ncbi:MAG: glycogen/starch/alpha-glucan phosphorylase [Burkholderiaceae bacterium]|nr:glycogen/starch/alpha-glucan phosphorylase [Burkholderiaceae bacterium]
MNPKPMSPRGAPDTPAAPEDVAQRRARFRAAHARALAQCADRGSAWSMLRSAAAACRGELADRWAATQAQDAAPDAPRRVHYMSMEFLMGRALRNTLDALDLSDEMQSALHDGDLPLADVLECEPEPGLGNGGLGRLAACFLDAFATLGLPSFGYGVRYEYGMFAQAIAADGHQVEHPDHWLRLGNPWEIPRPELRYRVGFGGQVHGDGAARRWRPSEEVVAMAYDFIVPGHGTQRVSTLRLWSACADDGIDFATFCRGQHLAAGAHRLAADLLNWVLYPDDSTQAGRELRLKQEFLLVSASLQDLINRHLRERGTLADLGERNAVHLNDTHPALTPLELMRLLIDEHALPWERAWAITRQAVSYTNHTLLPEALETWPVRMMQALLPRHLEIAYEINHRHLEAVRASFPGDEELASRLSLVDHNGEDRLRMAALSIVASHRVNGVSALHSELMVKTIFADFARLAPQRFTNVTNGVTPRRWLAQANPALSQVLDAQLGPGWRSDLEALRALAPSPALGDQLLQAKRRNKQRLAELVRRELKLELDPDSLFDVQVKRIHEYKRQLLNLLHVVARYQAIVAHPTAQWTARTVVFAGKAASAYQTARTIVHLIHDVARVVNADPRTGGRLKVAFLPNYGVSLAEVIIPAADLSEQISTAGTEASGTGNMKLALNGALTIGTWDGANIEMGQAIGEQHMFVFGLRADAVVRLRAEGYKPRQHVDNDPALRKALEAIGGGAFSPDEPARYRGLIDGLLTHDTYMVLADFADYLAAQRRVDALYRQRAAWTAAVCHNIAAMGRFSVDRTVREYAHKVWLVPAQG